MLLTCKVVNEEATPIFYGANKIVLYAEDNNDIFYWLLDIGDTNRRAIRHLELGYAYGVEIASGRGNFHGIVARINEMDESQEEEIQKHRGQLLKVAQRMESKMVRLIIRTLNLLVINQNLVSLAVYLPGVDGGDIWDIPNDNIYFAEEIFSNSTTNVYACIPNALRKMVGIQTLTIGYTKDIVLAEEIARDIGTKELIIRVHPEGNSLGLNTEERALWSDAGWSLDGSKAHKWLTQEKQRGNELEHAEKYSESNKAKGCN